MRTNWTIALLAALTLLGSTVGAAPYTPPIPGEPAPDFRLTDINGVSRTLGSYTRQGKVVVIEFFDKDCPYAQRYHEGDNFMAESMDDFSGEDVAWLAVDSTRASASELRTFARQYDWPAMPVLRDTTGHVQRAYGISVAPSIVVVSPNREIVYRGALDSSSINDERTGGENYLKAAINAALDNDVPPVTETMPDGCPL
jgi:peroxiredoxin